MRGEDRPHDAPIPVDLEPPIYGAFDLVRSYAFSRSQLYHRRDRALQIATGDQSRPIGGVFHRPRQFPPEEKQFERHQGKVHDEWDRDPGGVEDRHYRIMPQSDMAHLMAEDERDLLSVHPIQKALVQDDDGRYDPSCVCIDIGGSGDEYLRKVDPDLSGGLRCEIM